jgi:hypothetical protein
MLSSADIRKTSIAVGAAVALFAFQAYVQLTHEFATESDLSGAIEYANILSLVATMAALTPVVLAMGRIAGAARATRVVLTGFAVLSVLCVSSAINGGDLAVFPAVAIPANLMWFGGFIALGVILFRHGVVERRYAFALPLVWVALLPFSQVGGAIVAAVLLVAVTHRLGLLGGAGRAPAPAVA